MANRTVLVDNNTWNNTHIATVGRAMASKEKQAWEVFRSLDCTHVLVIFGGFIGYVLPLLCIGRCGLLTLPTPDRRDIWQCPHVLQSCIYAGRQACSLAPEVAFLGQAVRSSVMLLQIPERRHQQIFVDGEDWRRCLPGHQGEGLSGRRGVQGG